MGTAREVASKYPSPILNVAYRRRQLEFRRRQISQWLTNETDLLKFEVETQGQATKLPSDYVSERLASIEREAKRQESEALATYGMLAGSDPSVAPLRRALAVWGLTIDDVGVASVSIALLLALSLSLTPVISFSQFHGTSTVANDKNESNAYNEQFRHLGRAKGNACPVIAQKWLTGTSLILLLFTPSVADHPFSCLFRSPQGRSCRMDAQRYRPDYSIWSHSW